MISVQKNTGTGIVMNQGYGDHFIEVPTEEILLTMDKMARAFIELKEGEK